MELTVFETIKRSSIINSKGVPYNQFRAGLKPRYALVWFHVLLGYICLALFIAASAYIQTIYPQWFIITIPLCGFLIGYTATYLHLFLHEAAHFNIHPDKETNDTLANIFFGLMIGTHIKFYRLIHFDHHRYLGTPKDPEKTYFDGFNWRFLLESITGIRVIRIILLRKTTIRSNDAIDPKIATANTRMFFLGILFNISVMLVMLYFMQWQLALSWAFGIIIIFPFITAVREVLEHRSEAARATIDYNTTEHGITNRLFGTGIIASTMGGAGFNRHLLHHWEPQISYTRLKDIEAFLADTELAIPVKKARTSYRRTFIRLFNR